jgi:hypothetical protein
MTLGLVLVFMGGLLVLAALHNEPPWEPLIGALGG